MPPKTKQLQQHLLQLLENNYNCVNVVSTHQIATAGKSTDCKLRLNTAAEREETTASGRELQALKH